MSALWRQIQGRLQAAQKGNSERLRKRKVEARGILASRVLPRTASAVWKGNRVKDQTYEAMLKWADLAQATQVENARLKALARQALKALDAFEHGLGAANSMDELVGAWSLWRVTEARPLMANLRAELEPKVVSE